jgi:hypothetical protein
MKVSGRPALPATFHRIGAAGGASALGDGIYLSALPLADLFRSALLAGVTGLVTAAIAYLPDLFEREPSALRRANARPQGTQQALEGWP